MNTQEKVRLPGFTAQSSVVSASPLRARNSSSRNLGVRVVSPAQTTQNCNCSGGGGSTGTGGGNPGVCNCSSVLGAGCSVTGNSCNPGFVPQCNCGFLGNSCQCVPSLQ